MVTVAVAGGTGKLGLTIVEVLKANPKHKVIVLSRKAPEVHDEKAPVFALDYTDVDALVHVLEDNSVHTIISAMQVSTPESGAAEINLVKAATRSSHAKRFISSEWSAPTPDSSLDLPHNAPRAATIKELQKTDLEWTRFYVGQIMDHLGTPHIKSHMGVYSIHFDMANRAAAIPGTGNDLLSFTYSFDVARFVEAALDMARWENEMFCYSDNGTYNDVLKLAEEARGSKFTVTYDSVEKLERGEMTELPFHPSWYPRIPKPALQRRYATFGLLTIQGLTHLPEEKSLNKVFPQIQTKTVEEMVGAWKGK
ncbi:MAG: hypothetical protein M1819_003146 [Sarea resinae]|nr:MAG: hypothetical protein M1819_003146 [Sarea resinae]